MLNEDETITAHPLQWPAGWRRTQSRRDAKFYSSEHVDHGSWKKKELTVFDALERIFKQLERMGVSHNDILISTNVALRLDGLPRSDQGNPADPGAAVYWRAGKQTRCIASDQYIRVADNLAAIAATLDAMRLIRRHGGSEILDRAFIGFKMLAQPEQWWQILGLTTDAPTEEQIRDAHITLAKLIHPDMNGANSGGTDWRMARINQARDQGLEQIGVTK